eukprot:1185008-Prorocentrum_minimum.AAC.4
MDQSDARSAGIFSQWTNTHPTAGGVAGRGGERLPQSAPPAAALRLAAGSGRGAVPGTAADPRARPRSV